MEDYKSGQASLTRLVAWMVLILTAILGCVELYSWLPRRGETALIPLQWFRDVPFFHVPFSWQFLVAAALFVAVVYVVRWFMHRPTTVDTLIETEQEMKKVSWPTKDESFNATWVVLLVTVILTMSLFFFDYSLSSVLRLIF